MSLILFIYFFLFFFSFFFSCHQSHGATEPLDGRVGICECGFTNPSCLSLRIHKTMAMGLFFVLYLFGVLCIFVLLKTN